MASPERLPPRSKDGEAWIGAILQARGAHRRKLPCTLRKWFANRRLQRGIFRPANRALPIHSHLCAGSHPVLPNPAIVILSGADPPIRSGRGRKAETGPHHSPSQAALFGSTGPAAFYRRDGRFLGEKRQGDTHPPPRRRAAALGAAVREPRGEKRPICSRGIGRFRYQKD